MPRFVGDALPVVPWVGEVKPELPGVPLQPAKFPRACEGGFQFQVSRRPEIERPTGVVLAASRHSAHAEDILDALAARELAPDDGGLSRDAAKRRQRSQGYANCSRGGLHFSPSLRGGRDQAENAAVILRTADENQTPRLGLEAPLRPSGVLSRDAEPGPEFAPCLTGHSCDRTARTVSRRPAVRTTRSTGRASARRGAAKRNVRRSPARPRP